MVLARAVAVCWGRAMQTTRRDDLSRRPAVATGVIAGAVKSARQLRHVRPVSRHWVPHYGSELI